MSTNLPYTDDSNDRTQSMEFVACDPCKGSDETVVMSGRVDDLGRVYFEAEMKISVADFAAQFISDFKVSAHH